MFARLLVPLDGTPEAEAALWPTRTLAMALGADVTLIRVVPAEGSRLRVLDSPLVGEAHDYLQGIRAMLAVSSAETEVVVSEGSPADTIVAEAKSRRAELIITATQDRIGSVVEGVLSRSPVPVEVVHPGAQEMRRMKLMLVPTDGSPESYLAVTSAVQLARSASAALVLLRVVVPLPLWINDPSLGLNTGPLIDLRWDEGRRQNAEREVRELARRLSDSGVEVGADAVLGEVAPTIAEYADNEAVDLIVMSTHTRRGPARALLGSVADKIVRTTHQPVLLVKPEHRPTPSRPEARAHLRE